MSVPSNCGFRDAKSLADFKGNLAGKKHVKTGVAHGPGDEVACARQLHGFEAVECKTRLVRADKRGRATVGKDEEAEDFRERLRLLKVQGAELQIDEQRALAGFGAGQVPRKLKAVDGGIAAHKADVGALCAARQAKVVEDVEVQPGATMPVHVVTTTWPMLVRSSSVNARRSRADRSSAGAVPSNRRMRSAVEGNAPGR